MPPPGEGMPGDTPPPQPPPPPNWGAAPPPSGYGQPAYGANAAPVDPLGRPLAEWWKRLVALIIDGLIVAVVVNIVTRIIGFGTVLSLLVSLAAGFVYYGLLNAAPRGQTVGKMAFRIQTVDAENGQLLDTGRSMLRYLIVFLLSLPCGIPYIIDGLSALWDKRRQTWHDKVAHSQVIQLP